MVTPALACEIHEIHGALARKPGDIRSRAKKSAGRKRKFAQAGDFRDGEPTRGEGVPS
jgi:hypothetical protein